MNEKKPYSKAIVFLLKKTVENNSPVWNDIITYQKDIQNYLSDIGLELVIKKDEGFAYLKQFALDDDNTLSLVQRRQLSFEVSILLIVLRQVLEDFDNNPTDTHSIDKIISNNEIKDEIRLFLPETYNKVKYENELERHIKTAVELGFLKEVKRNNNEVRYRIHRIIKEKVTLDVQVPSSGGASIPLYAWKSNSDDTIAYTLTPNPKIEESAFYDFDLTTKVAKPENEFGINDTDESGYITYDEWTFQRDSTLDTIVSGPAYIALNSGSILPAGQKVYMCALDTSTYSTFTVFCPDTDGTSSVSDLFSNAGAEGAPSYAGTIGNIHLFFPYTG